MEKLKIESTTGVTSKNWTFYGIIGVISDIIIYPIIFVALFSSFIMFNAKLQNRVPQIFGYSIVQVVSGSMTKSGFEIGHNVFVKKTNVEELRVGDIIAFYYSKDPADSHSLSHLTLLEKKDANGTILNNRENFTVDENYVVDGRKPVKELGKTVKVYFHHIEEIYTDDGGTIFYKTKGSSNNVSDSVLTRQDYVVGRYLNTPMWLRSVFSFCNSATGMIFLVICPLSILILFQCLSIIEQVNNMVLERKIIDRIEPWNSKESFKANIGIEMDLSAKIYFFATAKASERDEIWKFIWSYLYVSDKPKNLQLLTQAKNSFELINTDIRSYWNYWFRIIKNKRELKKLTKYYERYCLEKM